MGRPPIGKRAMSGSERQRRYLDRLLQTAQGDTKLKSELAAAQARIQKLTSELAAAKAPGDGDTTLKAELAAAKARIAELEAANTMLKAEIAAWAGAGRPPPKSRLEEARAQATAERKAKRAAAAEARRAAAGVQEPPDVPTLLAENESITQQLKAARTQIRNLKGQISYTTRMQGAVFTPELEKAIRVCLHPDWVTDAKQQRRYEQTLAEFNAVMDAKKKGRAR
jgi:seryl-tRNA synthetase